MSTTDTDGSAELLSGDEFRRRAAEAAARALAEGEPFSIVACVPQQLPGERASDVVLAAASCVTKLLRGDDIVGQPAKDVLAIALPDTDADGARVLAFRIKSELRLRTAHLRSTVWEAGYASLYDDGETADELIDAAFESAKVSRLKSA